MLDYYLNLIITTYILIALLLVIFMSNECFITTYILKKI